MVTGILGKKVGMTRVFLEDGRWVPVTVIEAGPCTVVQRKTVETDGYVAAQLGFGPNKPSRFTKPLKGHFAKIGVDPLRVLREFALTDGSELKAGDVVKADLFQAGERVDVAGTSKGKGFQGVIKRHGFSGGPGGHGSHFHREPGSIGQSADPSKVIKGNRMPGHMGNVRVSGQNIEVVRVDPERNLLLLRGTVPGPNGAVVEIRKAAKKAKGS
jgi:large subunit ribosomal protein L3